MRFPYRILAPVLLAACLCPGASPAAAADRGRISGEIRSASGHPLQNALVTIVKVALKEDVPAVTGIRSNPGGLFSASDLDPGLYYVQVRREGFRSHATERFEVRPDRTTSLDITLESLIQYLSDKDDPRNWDLKTMLRSSSDDRMIFRHLPVRTPGGGVPDKAPFLRGGSMSLSSNTPIGNEPHASRPHPSLNGVITNFALSEPLGRKSRMIFSGQFDAGKSAYWRVRNTINYRPDDSHDYDISFGYGRMNVDYNGKGPAEEGSRESGIQLIAFGLKGTTKLYDLFSIHYGFDYSHLHYGTDRGFIHPSMQIVLTPTDGWRFTTSFTSRRASDANSLMLAPGEAFDLSEPTLITVVGDDISMSQVRHSEMAVERTLARDTTVEAAVYKDNTLGPGIPLMVTVITPESQTSTVIHLRENQTPKQGMRLTFNRRLQPNLRGSFAYVYGEAAHVSDVDASETIDGLSRNIQAYAGQRYYHSLTGQLDAFLPETNTNLLATVRWNPGNPVSAIDWFSDPLDIGSKSLNLAIRQAIPIETKFLSAGGWEILLDFRNILNQGEEVLAASDGVMVLNRNPRSLRFGLSLKFL